MSKRVIADYPVKTDSVVCRGSGDRPVTRDDRGGPSMALGERIVEIARLLGGELVQAEVVEEEQVRREPAPQFPLGELSARD